MSTQPSRPWQILFANTEFVGAIVQVVVLLEQQPRPNCRNSDKSTTQPGTACNRSVICNPKIVQYSLPCPPACPSCLRHHEHDLSGQVGSWPTHPHIHQQAVVANPGRGLAYLTQLATVSKAFYNAVMPILWSHLDFTVTQGIRVDGRFVSWLEIYLDTYGVQATTITNDPLTHGIQATTMRDLHTPGAREGGLGRGGGGGTHVQVLQMSRSVWSLFHRGAFEALGKAFPNLKFLELLEDSVNPSEGVQNDRSEVIFGAMNAQAQSNGSSSGGREYKDSLVDLFERGCSLSDGFRLDINQASGWYRPRLEDLAESFPNLESLVLPEGGLTMAAASSSRESVGDKRKQMEDGGNRKRLRIRRYDPHHPRNSHNRESPAVTSVASRSRGRRSDPSASILSFLTVAINDLYLQDPLDDGPKQPLFAQLQHVSVTFDPQCLENLDRILHDLCVSSLTTVEVRVRPMTLLWLVTEMRDNARYGNCNNSNGSANCDGGEFQEESFLAFSLRLIYEVLGELCPKGLQWLSIPNLDALARFAYDMDSDDGDKAMGICLEEDKEKSYGDLATEAICLRHCETLKGSLYIQPDPLDLSPEFFFV